MKFFSGVKLPIPHEKYVSYLLQGLFPPADEIGDVMSAFCLALLDANPHMWARMFDEVCLCDTPDKKYIFIV
jgi:hypothetical protein